MTAAPIPNLEGKGETRLAFDNTDQHYYLKTRALIGLCMPAVFVSMERTLNMRAVREQGIVPIMFYLQFETYPQALAFGGRVETSFTVRLCRSVSPVPGRSEPQERLMLDMQIDVAAQEGTGDPRSLGAGARSKTLVPAGRMRGLHVLTKPVAPPAERQVVDVPEPLRMLQEHRLEQPFPTGETLHEAPQGYAALDVPAWREQRSVWGLHNTDINQHVNVNEYIGEMENHFTRMLFGAGLPVADHRVERMNILFRKPFFRGDPHAQSGRLFRQGAHTLMLGGCHRLEPEGALDPRPSVFARIEGSLEPPTRPEA